MNMTTINTQNLVTPVPVSKVDTLKAERSRVSTLTRKLAHKLFTLEPLSDEYSDAYCKYTFLQDYREQLTTDIQLAIREERYGF